MIFSLVLLTLIMIVSLMSLTRTIMTTERQILPIQIRKILL